MRASATTLSATPWALSRSRTPSSTTANSSPPRRATASLGRTALAHPCGELLQHLIADRVAMLVVDRLEVIEVDVEQRHLGALVLLEAALEERLEAGPVQHAGQDVAMRQLEQPAGLLPVLT